jgi:hypothetical protein
VITFSLLLEEAVEVTAVAQMFLLLVPMSALKLEVLPALSVGSVFRVLTYYLLMVY